MTEQIPTPTPEQVRQWLGEFFGCVVTGQLSDSEMFLATQAARWGADQELEACREEILDGPGRLYIGDCKLRIRLADDIWTARRPKHKTLAEEALKELTWVDKNVNGPHLNKLRSDAVYTIRRALERLQELEGQS